MYALMINKSFIYVSSEFELQPVNQISSATLFDSYSNANNFVNTHIQKKIRYKYKIVNCDDLMLSDESLSKLVLDTVTDKTTKLIDEQIQMLNNALSLMDRKQQDILHYIEANEKFNLYQSWKIVHKLQKIRAKRRKIKKCLATLSSFKQSVNLEQLYLNQCESNAYSNRVIEDMESYIMNDDTE